MNMNFVKHIQLMQKQDDNVTCDLSNEKIYLYEYTSIENWSLFFPINSYIQFKLL